MIYVCRRNILPDLENCRAKATWLGRVAATTPTNQASSSHPQVTANAMPLIEGVYRSSRDRWAATVPAEMIKGFHSFTLTALARYTAPNIQPGVGMWTRYRNGPR
jgi:hypothetical protein